MQEQTARYEGATRAEAAQQFETHRPSAAEEGWSPIREDWFDEEGRAVLMVTYGFNALPGQSDATGAQSGGIELPEPSAVIYDQESQYKQILPWIIAGERLFAVYDCKGAGTGFVAITNKRLLFYDKAPLRKRKVLMSVPFTRISAVGSVDQGRGLLGATSELIVKTGSEEYEFEFRGGDKAQQAYRFIMEELLQEERA